MKSLIKVTSGLALALAAFASQTTANAQVLLSEGFDTYGQGVSIQGLNGGSGWSGSWNTSNQSNGYLFVTRGPATFSSLTYPNDTAASGQNYENLASGFGGNQSTNISRGVDTSVVTQTAGQSLWGSVIYTSDSNPTGTLSLGLGSNAFNLAAPQGTNLLVYRIDYGATVNAADSTITLWTDPNLTSSATFFASASTTTANLNLSFNSIVFGQTYTAGSGTESGIDSILVGKTLTDVTGVQTSSAVPEPSTSGLLILGGALSAVAFVVRRKTAAQI